MAKPCCPKPLLRFAGRQQCNSVESGGCTGINWYSCRSCGKQVSKLLFAKDLKPIVAEVDPDRDVRPSVSPTCCQTNMVWIGPESVLVGRSILKLDAWQCSFCDRVLRVPCADTEELPD